MKLWHLGASALALLFAASPAFATPQTKAFTPIEQLVSPCGSSTNVFCPAQDVEPEVRTDTMNRTFVSAIRGVPAGTDLWEVPNQTFRAGVYPTYYYRGQPDGLPVFTPAVGPAPGGGDTDLAIGSFATTAVTLPANTTCSPTGGVPSTNVCVPGPLVITSLNLATVYGSSTADAGMTYTPSPAVNDIPGNDREWNNSYGGLERYDVVHDLYSDHIDFSKNLDGGIGPWIEGTPTDCSTSNLTLCAITTQNNELGAIVVDQNKAAGPILYEVFVSDATAQENANGNVNAIPFHTVYVSKSVDDGTTWTTTVVYNGPLNPNPGYGHLFPSMAVDAQGYLYAIWSDNTNIFMAYSTDGNATWHGLNGAVTSQPVGTATQSPNAPIQVTNSAKDGGYMRHIFPWIHAGFNGGVDVVYYESQNPGDPSTTESDWYVGMAQNVNVTGTNMLANRNFMYYTASNNNIIHHGTICENGIACTGAGNRNLADDFQIYLDPFGKANIAFTDDYTHPMDAPETYFVHQVFGSNLGTPNGGGPNQGCSAYGTTVPGATTPAGLPVQVAVKAPKGVSRGWMTLKLSNAVAALGYINSYQPISRTAANFAGVTTRNLAFAGSIANGQLNVKVGTGTVRATLTKGTILLK